MKFLLRWVGLDLSGRLGLVFDVLSLLLLCCFCLYVVDSLYIFVLLGLVLWFSVVVVYACVWVTLVICVLGWLVLGLFDLLDLVTWCFVVFA